MATFESGSVSGRGADFPPPSAEILQPWHDFPVAQEPRPIVFLDALVHLGDTGFVDGDANLSWMAGAIETTVALPVGVIELLTEGRPRRHAPEVLLITSIEACEEQFVCDRGLRSLPAYRLVVRGLRQPCTVLDPAVDYWWPRFNGRDHASGVRRHASIGDDGLTVNFPASGGVLTTFHRAEFIEYPTCVVGNAVTSQRRVPPGTAVRAVGIGATVTGRLNTPLGGRVLRHATGAPVAAGTGAADRG